jgi:DNA adenine methylase
MRIYGPEEFELPFGERDLRWAGNGPPLRYPGGKSRALGDIVPLVPDFREYREPFLGGGSVFAALRRICLAREARGAPEWDFWINDLNGDLWCLWRSARDDPSGLASEVRRLRREHLDGRELFESLRASDPHSELRRGARYFVLNRVAFSGLADSGGYSQYSFEQRFTESSVRRLEALGEVLRGVKITRLDYSELLRAGGEGVFIFLDPPYLGNKESRLYGEGGELHAGFDHGRLAEELRRCGHRWLMTIDDVPESRELFSFACVSEWELQYGMNNAGGSDAEAGRELFVSNYDLAGYRERHGQMTLDGFLS